MTFSLEPNAGFPSIGDLTRGQSAGCTLKSGTIDLWSCSLDGSAAALERCQALLCEEERARAARFMRPQDQMGFRLAHGGLRFVLARYLEIEPAALPFYVEPTGKPVLLDKKGRPHTLRFNLSHSHGRMLVAVTNGRDVGVDLEQIRSNREVLKLAERFYTQAEFQSIKTRPPSEQAVHFYRVWVAKEAWLKAHGAGISSLQQCEILPSTASSRASVKLICDSTISGVWTVQWLSCGSDWQGAVCTYGNDWSVRVLDGMSA